MAGCQWVVGWPSGLGLQATPNAGLQEVSPAHWTQIPTEPLLHAGAQGMGTKDTISVLEELEIQGGQACREAAVLAEQRAGAGGAFRKGMQEVTGMGMGELSEATSGLAARGWGGWSGLLALADGLPESQGGLLASKPILLELLAPRTQRRNFPRFLADSLLSGQPLPSLSYTLGGDFRVSR